MRDLKLACCPKLDENELEILLGEGSNIRNVGVEFGEDSITFQDIIWAISFGYFKKIRDSSFVIPSERWKTFKSHLKTINSLPPSCLEKLQDPGMWPRYLMANDLQFRVGEKGNVEVLNEKNRFVDFFTRLKKTRR
jgi:hypothetical protein